MVYWSQSDFSDLLKKYFEGHSLDREWHQRIHEQYQNHAIEQGYRMIVEDVVGGGYRAIHGKNPSGYSPGSLFVGAEGTKYTYIDHLLTEVFLLLAAEGLPTNKDVRWIKMLGQFTNWENGVTGEPYIGLDCYDAYFESAGKSLFYMDNCPFARIYGGQFKQTITDPELVPYYIAPIDFDGMSNYCVAKDIYAEGWGSAYTQMGSEVGIRLENWVIINPLHYYMYIQGGNSDWIIKDIIGRSTNPILQYGIYIGTYDSYDMHFENISLQNTVKSMIYFKGYNSVFKNLKLKTVTGGGTYAGLEFANATSANLRLNRIEDSTFYSAPIGVKEAAFNTPVSLIKNNVFDTITTPVLVKNVYSRIVDNDGYNPIGVFATPFRNTTPYGIGLLGTVASPTANRKYTAQHTDWYVKATSQTGGTVKLYAPDGVTELMNLGASGFTLLLPYGYQIDFGDFTVAPTVVASGC